MIGQWSSKTIGLEDKRFLGLQFDKWMLIVSKEKLSETSLFHEMLHVVDDFVYSKNDGKHEDLEWWLCELELNIFYQFMLNKQEAFSISELELETLDLGEGE